MLIGIVFNIMMITVFFLYSNHHWFLSWMHSPSEIKTFISSLVGEFSDMIFTDVSEMLALESGWVFESIVNYDIRICHNLPDNFVRYAGKVKTDPFHPHLRDLFCRTVIDPTKYLRKGYDRDNLCVPMTIILACHFKLGPPLNGNSASMTTLRQEMNYLNFEAVMKVEQVGLSLSELSSFENILSPIPTDLIRCFPQLVYFKGISISAFTIQRRETDFRIFPTSLSPYSRDSNYFKVDILIDSPDIRPLTSRSFDSCETKVCHVLAIKDLASLLNRFGVHKTNSFLFSHICRTCMRVFSSNSSKLTHYQICQNHKRGVIGRRRVQNSLIHRPYKFNKWNGKLERNGIFFRRKWVYRQLAPLGFVIFDYEQYHEKVDVNRVRASNFEGPFNRSTETVQVPMAFSHVMKSNYTEHPLPPHLSLPRVKFLNPHEENSERTFFTDLLTSMRDDLISYHDWMMDILSQDQGPLQERYRTAQDLAYFRSVGFCQLCGQTFGSKLWSETTKSYYKVKKCYDHDHYLRNSKNVRAVICAGKKNI